MSRGGMEGEPTQPVDASSLLLQQLRALKRSEEDDLAETAAARKEWIESVEGLLSALRAWMLPIVREGLARLDAAVVHVTQDDVGAYDAPALKITMPGGRVVWVRPVGTLRVGARGIVDVVCGSSRALFVLNRRGVWKVRGAGPVAPLTLLDRSTFSRMLGELIL